MWTTKIQRASYWICTVPVFCWIALIWLLRYKSVNDDLNKCSAVVKGVLERGCDEITESLIQTLVAGEDHRNHLHYGVDPVGILRSLKVRLLHGERQGASTIEQQFVRTVTQRYEKTPRRKVREQILAVMLNSRFTKDEISASYLAVAYYGVSLVGLRGLRILKVDVKEYVNETIVAHLKYPRTPNRKSYMAHRHTVRVRHIRALLTARRERHC